MPSLYSTSGGNLLTTALNERLTLLLASRKDGRIRIAHGEFGVWSDPFEPQPSDCLASAAIVTLWPCGADIRVTSPIEAGAGLGGSGAFSIALCAGLMRLARRQIHTKAVVELAVHVERDVYGSPIGIQDAAAAAFGGFLELKIDRSGNWQAARCHILERSFREKIAPHLMLIDTGKRRSARRVLSSMEGRVDPALSVRLRKQVKTFRSIIKAGDVEAFGRELSEHWNEKRRRSAEMSSSEISAVYELGLATGCAGGKLVGAGGGGFFLFAGWQHALARLRSEAGSRGLEVRQVIPDSGGGCAVV